MQGTAIPYLDMGGATIKMNDDASFNLLVGATDLGTGSDTVLAQMAAEVLGVPLDDILIYSSDTDFTPFDKGAYASSTTYITGGAVRKAALLICDMVLEHAAAMLDLPDTKGLTLGERTVIAADGRTLTFGEIALSSLHQFQQHQIMATASHMSTESPPPTAATFAEVDVDTETGQVKVERLVSVVDCGRVINPITAIGQMEGGMAQGLGFALSEETYYSEKGNILNARLGAYLSYKSNDMPIVDAIFVQTDEPAGPYGAKSISEISIDGIAPAIVSAVHDATGVWIRTLPLTPERVWRALKEK
jgi:putative selenate reductase molybdopterin-binding subunit